MGGIGLPQRVPHHDQIISGKINRDGNMLSGAKPTNFSAILSGKDNSISVSGDDEWRGEEVRHDERDAALEPLFGQPFIYQADAGSRARNQHVLHRDIFVQRQTTASNGGMIR